MKTFPRAVGVLLSLICLSLLPLPIWAAEYKGHNIDGERYECTAFSYGTAKYYNLQVEFDGDEATIYFPKGGSVKLTLDDEEIGDPDSISAFDYKTATYWDLDVEGLD